MRVHIFRAGSYTDMRGQAVSLSTGDVAALAAGYDPGLHEAPIVVGHPTHDQPAFGWVANLSAEGSDLYANLRQVEPAFAEAVREGRYKKISASFYMPKTRANPRPGTPYLKHVGFLGAAAPAVKGLTPVSLADQGDAVTIELGEATMREFALAAREAAVAERERRVRDADLFSEVDTLIAEARLPQGLRTEVVQFLERLDTDEAAMFGEPGSEAPRTLREQYLSLLKRQPPMVPLGVEIAGHGAAFADEDDAGFDAPAGFEVDREGLDLHRRAVDYQKRTGCDYATAVRAVARK